MWHRPNTRRRLFYCGAWIGPCRQLPTGIIQIHTNPTGSAIFFHTLLLGLKRFRQELEGEGVENFACMDDTSFGHMGVTNMIKTIRILTDMRNKPPAAFVTIESLGQRISYIERALDTSLSLEACRRVGKGRSGHMNKSSSYRERRRNNRSSRRVVRMID